MFKRTLSVTAVSIFCSVASFLSQLEIAGIYGTSHALDSYLIACSIPSMLSGAIASTLSYSLIPQLMAHRKSEKDFFRLTASFFYALLALVVVITLIGWITTGPVLLANHAVAPEQLDEVAAMARLSWLWAGVLILVSFFCSVLNAQRSFIWPVMIQAMPYVGIIAVVGAMSQRWGAAAVPAGVLIGATAALLLTWPRVRKHISFRHIRGIGLVGLSAFIKDVPYVVFALSCFSSYTVIDAWWSSRFAVGELSALGFAERLLIAGGAFVIVAPATLLVSDMADASEQRGVDGARMKMLSTVNALAVIAVLVAVVGYFFSSPAVSLIFQRGMFDRNSCIEVVRLFKILLVGIMPMLASTLLFRGMFQLGASRLAAALGVAWSILYFVAGGVLRETYSAKGMVMAYCISWSIVWAIGMWWLLASLTSGELRQTLKIYSRILAAGSLTALYCKWQMPMDLFDAVTIPQLALIALKAAGAIALYFLVFFSMRVGKSKPNAFALFKSDSA